MNKIIRLSIYTTTGATIGGYLPYLWGETNFISFAGIIFSSLGSAIGIIIAYKKNKKILQITNSLHTDEEEIE